MASSRIRILHCIPSLVEGGAERQVRMLLPELVRQKCDCALFARLDTCDIDTLSAAGVAVFPSAENSNYTPRASTSIVRAIRAWQPDVVQTWLIKSDVLGGAAALWTRTPWVLSERASLPQYEGPLKSRLRLRQAIGRFATAIVSNSRTGLDVWPRHRNRRVIENAIDFERLAGHGPPDEGSFAIPDGAPLVLMICRLDPMKGPATGVAAMAQVRLAHPQAHLAILGIGAERAALQAQAASLGLAGQVHIPGGQKNVGWWLKRASLFVSCSLGEGQSNAVLEAAASRVPMVLSDIPPHREVFGEAQAIYVATGDVAGFARAIGAVLDWPAACEIRTAAAYEVVRGRHVETCASAYKMLYEEIVAQRDRH